MRRLAETRRKPAESRLKLKASQTSVRDECALKLLVKEKRLRQTQRGV